MSTSVAIPPPVERHEPAARTYQRRLTPNLVAGRGAAVTDNRGRPYIDCLAGAGALALGHGHQVVVDALQRALREDVLLATLDLSTPARSDLIAVLFGVLPPGTLEEIS